ncbi:MAG: hypothetical protein KatS3mg033_0996 [Thermonema sp.]|nr:MAG: hypothetical protein KatS3mg033_0996 [Thermonema sp.]
MPFVILQIVSFEKSIKQTKKERDEVISKQSSHCDRRL